MMSAPPSPGRCTRLSAAYDDVHAHQYGPITRTPSNMGLVHDLAGRIDHHDLLGTRSQRALYQHPPLQEPAIEILLL
jgi:hypothetical protein